MFPWVSEYRKERFLEIRNRLLKTPLRVGDVAGEWLTNSIMHHTHWAVFKRTYPQASYLTSINEVYNQCQRRGSLTQDDINTINALFGVVKIRSLDEYM